LSTSWSTPDPKQANLTPVEKTAADSKHSKRLGTQDCYNHPPLLSFKVPELSDLPNTWSKWNDVELPVDFLVLTVEDCEFLGFFSYLEKSFRSYSREVGCVYFGFLGNGGGKKLKVALMRSSKGSAVPGGSLTVAKDAVHVLRPKAVFSVGACIGLNHDKGKLGDVVVSSKLTTAVYKTPASRDVSNLIRHAADGWQAPLENPGALEVRVHCDSDLLSWPEGVSEDINPRCAEAIAVEMEGEGLFAAAHDLKTEWVVVKGIKDYKDGSQSLTADEWGVFASVMAASVVANILNDAAVFQEWPNYQGKSSAFQPSNRMLDAKLKKIKKHAIGHEDLRRLKESAVINPKTPRGLLYNVWFHVALYFPRLGREGQRKLTKASFLFLQDEGNNWYATMAHDESRKTHQGGKYDTATNYEKRRRMYQTEHQSDGFNALQLYCRKLNPACNAFFQFPKRYWNGPEESVWFENRCLGVNKLGSMMEELNKKANLSHVYTNHCIRATAVTLWSDAGLSNSLSSHGNENSLKSYDARPSSQQLQECSNVLSSTLNPKATPADQQMQVLRGNQQQLQQSGSVACAMIPNQQNFTRHDEQFNFSTMFSGCQIGQVHVIFKSDQAQ